MGLDLSFAPIQWSDSGIWWLAVTRLRCDREYMFFAQIGDTVRFDDVDPVCTPMPLPPRVDFQWYEDEGIKTRTKDPYGSPLAFVWARDFRKISYVPVSEWNKAVLHFLKELPPDTPVVLWWS